MGAVAGRRIGARPFLAVGVVVAVVLALLVGSARPARAQIITIPLAIFAVAAELFADAAEAAAVVATVEEGAAVAAPVVEAAGAALEAGATNYAVIEEAAAAIEADAAASLATNPANVGLTESVLAPKTVASYAEEVVFPETGSVINGEGQKTLSGWAGEYRSSGGDLIPDTNPTAVRAYLDDLAIPVEENAALDGGVPGQYYSSHAELQAHVHNWTTGPVSPAVGVSRNMCASCVDVFTQAAEKEGATLYVADPQGVHVFSGGAHDLLEWQSVASSVVP